MPTAPTAPTNGPTPVVTLMSASSTNRSISTLTVVVAAGVVIEEIFERFCQAEFHTDWDAGLASGASG